jgi:acetyl esterase/lipase
VEYRRAPEHPYPAALDDCYAALQWVGRNAREIGVAPEAIGIAGLSAGGGLTAALALMARDRGEMVRFQLLDSPMLDDRRRTPSSREPDLQVWSRESNEYGWRSYLGERYGTDDVPDYAAPARAEDLTNLPPAFVAVGSVDGFRDEDIEYATRLSQAGVPTELHVYPGVPHGFGMFADIPAARQMARDAEAWLARQFGIDLPEIVSPY